MVEQGIFQNCTCIDNFFIHKNGMGGVAMDKNTVLLEKENAEQKNNYTVVIDKNTFHIVSKFQGKETSSHIIYRLAVKKILYDDQI